MFQTFSEKKEKNVFLKILLDKGKFKAESEVGI
jgi:hypothetical protein